ncbi:MAG: 2-amino-4-hydroxy-6-hydroxymethyldihydropteridine diphosphokinase [Symbiobacterium sp.]|uniref:2-amino-4-hydroxy-6- hydroxymethyldihydropteridine diphosphokinase n=1 Tax=Symbiobacterium sp. TaxID=1971213 RepID=UPI0034643464
MTHAYVSLGANIGDPEAQLVTALRRLDASPGVRLVSVSGLYRTAPQGRTDQPDFLNCAACLETTLAPLELLDLTQAVEADLGRVRKERWGPRTIDIDILLHGRIRMQGDRLTLPHPRMAERAFMLVPLLEVWQPGDGPEGARREDLEAMLARLPDQGVRLVEDRASFLQQVKRVE